MKALGHTTPKTNREELPTRIHPGVKNRVVVNFIGANGGMGQTPSTTADKTFDLLAVRSDTIDIEVLKRIARKVNTLDNVELNVDMLDALNRNKIASKISMSESVM